MAQAIPPRVPASRPRLYRQAFAMDGRRNDFLQVRFALPLPLKTGQLADRPTKAFLLDT